MENYYQENNYQENNYQEISEEMRIKLKLIYEALSDKKAHDIRILDIANVSAVSDYFVIAGASNNNQLQAMCDNVEDSLFSHNFDMKNREGRSNAGWILLDFYDIIIHIFTDEQREFYDLEHTWHDARRVFVD